MKIESIIPHPAEEDLDIVTLGPGIKCVIHKGQFNVNDEVKLVPMKTVKKGIICHGMIVKEGHYVRLSADVNAAPVFPTETVKLSEEEPMFTDPDMLEDLDPDYHGDPLSMIDDAEEEDGKNFAQDE